MEAETGGTAHSLGCLEEARSCLEVVLAVLPPQHLVVIRSHLAVVRAAQAVIAANVRRRSTRKEHTEDERVAHVAAVSALRSCVAVDKSRYLPPTHHERATTASDMAALLGYLLSANPELLYRELAPEGFGSFSLASRAEFAAKNRAEVLQAVYE